MNFYEITSAVKHLLKNSKCVQCKKKYRRENINIIATTKSEGLFDLRCSDCKCSSIVTVYLTPKSGERAADKFGSISPNDILDIKNFLTGFDGDFKKIFSSEK